MIERKLIRGGGIIGHIEDIAVSKSMQGRKLGIRIINTLEDIGRAVGCYKIILDCSVSNIRESVYSRPQGKLTPLTSSFLREVRVSVMTRYGPEGS
jgi:GNAT superfamily N-acetyltransferase